MRYPFTRSADNPTCSSKTCRFWTYLALLLIVFGSMLGCSSGGSDNGVGPGNCGGPSINNFMNTQVADIISGLTFTFMDGQLFQDTLSGDTVTLTLDTLIGTNLTLMLATRDNLAIGEVELVACRPLSQPACLFDVMVTESDFPSGEGPQVDDVLIFEDWRFTARVDTCTNRINANMIIEDVMGVPSTSATLDLSRDALRPML